MLIILKQGPAKGVALEELKKVIFAYDFNHGIMPWNQFQF